MSGRKKWSDVKHKCTPEQLAKARAELEDEMRAYEATPTQGGASSEGNDEEPDFRQLRDAARRGRRCANCLYPDACARTDTCRAAVQRLKVARGGIPAVNAPESVLSEAARPCGCDEWRSARDVGTERRDECLRPGCPWPHGPCSEWVEEETAQEAESVLAEAARLVDGDRQTAYGHPRDNHACTAELWTAYFRRCGLLRDAVEITARQVCIANVLQKCSRDANAPGRDNLVDISGFAANAEMVDE